MAGAHKFSPLSGPSRMWCPLDRLITHLIHHQIKSTFKHVVDEKCAHMQGPSAIKGIHKKIRPEIEKYAYFIRLDIKGFYASVDRKILSEIVEETYDDPIIVAYLKDVIHIAYDKGGMCIPRRKGSLPVAVSHPSSPPSISNCSMLPSATDLVFMSVTWMTS